MTVPGGPGEIPLSFSKKKTDTTIPAGTGFWYLNGGSSDKQIEWNK